MRKILTYIGFVIACVLVSLLFVTATTYIQLAVAVILYPIVAYFVMKILPRKTRVVPAVAVQTAGTQEEVADFDRRTFLKLVGATGIFFFVSSLFGKWAGALPFGKSLGLGGNSIQGNSATPGAGNPGSLTANGYQISEIDDGAITFYGFTNVDGSWLIMKEDTETSSFRYAKGSSGFPASWDNRQNLKYDYYYNLF
ncbi:MAG: hypothetical protein UV71_C0009G0005 [Microgenomates group bacterium GW2011_GWC1_43_13]|uniref:Uncharacterized protein n=3 Tax=Candidatus Woeseibacteriota TaxID=1752722 RepID=A0A837IDJ6_9BACT|nr:MAG: hypothetical protein UV71_C0009G0005 [Microgenomates group bacterium GW2011_GWC1_43_13]KKT32912.1 MAG: hypothetical protein UW20_C0007G0004 [Candidatus Woesebacteria bacterium GW2011_GWB1_44_11]KKT54497.1 MAG: hypothetical protein UW47_C0005G0045 [Candidatus Woesebacteria bacterium GW2011_GWA1_44_23]OGM75804.1 MAG: hypothetical protein A2208_01970 [Candidatus Woesebacteria bacterium RIFOXYA1_FULL_43_16]OGM81355.1 MAG: hypothetical protein A2394_00165 [Candidatus Woesebacteria bacterium 